MKVVYNPKYEVVYDSDPAAKAGRTEAILKEVSPHFQIVEAEPAAPDDLRLCHTEGHIRYIEGSRLVHETALLAVGGAIKASDLAMSGQPAFGLIRPKATTPAGTTAGASASSTTWLLPSPG